MEYVEGTDLRAEMDRRRRAGRPFTRDEILRIVGEIADALDYTHQRGVSTRKPAAQVAVTRAASPTVTRLAATATTLPAPSATPNATPTEPVMLPTPAPEVKPTVTALPSPTSTTLASEPCVHLARTHLSFAGLPAGRAWRAAMLSVFLDGRAADAPLRTRRRAV
jgi:hypothetical protein